MIIYAEDEDSAAKILGEMGAQSSAATVREIDRFVASFALTETGDLHTTLLDPGTLNQVAPDYPLLASARAHSYADFGSSSPGTSSEPALFNDATRQHDRNWDRRDKDVIACAVQQERERFSN